MFDIPTLLQPVKDDAPCGDDLSFDPEFDTIQENRRADDPSLDQGEWVTDLKSADWPAVARQCAELLQTRSKDLRLAVWLTEARTQLDGFDGLTEGFLLTAELCERYWETLHPEVDGDDQELRIGTLSWLLNQSIQWARRIALTDAAHGSYALADFETARARQGADGDHANGPSLADLDTARAGTSFEFYQRLSEQAPACLQALETLQQAVDARLGQHGPSFAATRDALEAVVHTAARFARDAGVHGQDLTSATPGSQAEPATRDGTPSPAGNAAPASNGEITSRKEALAQLRRVAEFFRRTEPHSPVAYLADKAARWGAMPLHVWLKSVIKDTGSLAQLEEMLDVGPDESRNG